MVVVEEQKIIKVTLFDRFSLRCQHGTTEYTLTEQDGASKRMWAFLQYLTVFHKRKITKEELIDALWGNDESDNPSNALKTLLYRSRVAMEQLGFPDGKQVLMHRRGIFTWGENIVLELDTDRFERLCAESANNLEQAMEAIALYHGDFIPGVLGSPWAVSMRTYYHNKFLKLCNGTTQLLIEKGCYEEAQRICQRAIKIDAFDETSHRLLMEAFAAAGSREAAIRHYEHVAQIFMDRLGVSPSRDMAQLYQQISMEHMNVEMDIDVIHKELSELASMPGAFFCEYHSFRDIYRIAVRNAAYSGQMFYLAMITVSTRDWEEASVKQYSAAMGELKRIIQENLRSGDIFMRSSISQYLLLLSTDSQGNAIKIIQRVLQCYQQTAIGMTTDTKFSVLPVQSRDERVEHPGKVFFMNQRSE